MQRIQSLVEPRLQQYQLGKYGQNTEMHAPNGTVRMLHNNPVSPPISTYGDPPQSDKDEAALKVWDNYRWPQFLICFILLRFK